MEFAKINPARDAEVSATYHVEFEGEPLFEKGEPIEMDFIGTDSAAGKRAGIRLAKRMDAINAGGKKERRLSDMSEDEISMRAARVQSEQATFYADLCTGWRNVTEIPEGSPDGKPVPLKFSREAAVALFEKAPWLHEGIDAFLADKANWRKSDKAA